MKAALIWSAPICALAVGLALAVPGEAAVAVATRPASSGSAYATFPGRLYSVAAVSARDVWAVGLNPTGSLIVHWDGTAWSQSLSGNGFLGGVADSSAGDVWAVGGTNWFSPTQPLAEHWDGSSWTQVPVPNPAGGGYLNGVAATSSKNAWAVGLVAPGGPGVPAPTTPLIEHWEGRRWTIQNYQAAPNGGQLDAVAAISARNAWAVGWTGPSSEGTGQQALIEHWNGTSWTWVPSPTPPGSSASFLRGVTIISARNAWAVGSAVVDGYSKTLTLHWDGDRWTVVPSPTPLGDGSFMAVAASWTNNIWAVGGTSQTPSGPHFQTLIEHWNSIHGRWTAIPSPNPPSDYLNQLWSVSAVSRNDIWAVGTTDYASTLIIHWNGTSWS
jgi:hypothetical protein